MHQPVIFEGSQSRSSRSTSTLPTRLLGPIPRRALSNTCRTPQLPSIAARCVLEGVRTLRHFILLCETLNFGRASRRANISTSALSRNIRQLETELNVSLFDRDNRTVELTLAGRKFQRYARNAVQQWEQICYELTDPAEQLQGEISLCCSVTASHSILFDLLNSFRPAHPGVEIRLQTGEPCAAATRRNRHLAADSHDPCRRRDSP